MAAKKKTKKKHDCIDGVNKALAKQGDVLQRFMVLRGSNTERLAIATERLEGKNGKWERGSQWLMATYCPFCGKRLAETDEKDGKMLQKLADDGPQFWSRSDQERRCYDMFGAGLVDSKSTIYSSSHGGEHVLYKNLYTITKKGLAALKRFNEAQS